MTFKRLQRLGHCRIHANLSVSNKDRGVWVTLTVCFVGSGAGGVVGSSGADRLAPTHPVLVGLCAVHAAPRI